MKYFTIEELSRSDVAASKGINNTPSKEAIENMTLLIERVLDPIREKWGHPIKVNSGYRCKALNDAVRGSDTSQHMTGQAADITTGMIGSNKILFSLIQTLGKNRQMEFDQLIDEKGMSWIHISYKSDGTNRNQILKL